MNPDVTAYEVEVHDEAAHGMEILHMLDRRDRLADAESALSAGDRLALRSADAELIQRARGFQAALGDWADLQSERHARAISPTRWWWYLDVIASIPGQLGRPDVASSVRA